MKKTSNKKKKNKEPLTFETSAYLTTKEERKLGKIRTTVVSKEVMQKRIAEGGWHRGSVDELYGRNNQQP